MKNFKNFFGIFVILIALLFTGMQNANAQTYFTLKLNSLCYDNCTTQENCHYKFYWVLVDQCGEHDEYYCPDSLSVDCKDIAVGFYHDVICDDCTNATHDPCFLVWGRVQKICTGPGGSHVICEDTQTLNRTCEELSSYGTTLIFNF